MSQDTIPKKPRRVTQSRTLVASIKRSISVETMTNKTLMVNDNLLLMLIRASGIRVPAGAQIRWDEDSVTVHWSE